MITFALILKLAIVGFMLVRTVCISVSVSRKEWSGHPLKFYLLSAGYSLLAGGSIAWLFGMDSATWLFGLGIAAMLLFDRRRSV